VRTECPACDNGRLTPEGPSVALERLSEALESLSEGYELTVGNIGKVKKLPWVQAGRLCLFAAALMLTVAARAQQVRSLASANDAVDSVALPDAPVAQIPGTQQTTARSSGSVHGVVMNKDGTVYEGAEVTLTQPGAEAKSATTNSEGRFDFAEVTPGAFTLAVNSIGFAAQLVTGTVQAGESDEVKPIVLLMSRATSDVEVTASPTEIAAEELKEEETQRVLGVIPNFYVTYVPDAPSLTSKQKFGLAFKSSLDPVTLLVVGAFAGQEQAQNTFSGYGQGAQGYGKRYGAGFADEFIASMIGGAILPTWWKQDPRYFYKGTGTTRSRIVYAIENAVMCRGDNGRRQVNYSAIVGGLAAGGISNLYYPASNRHGVGLTFENSAVGTATSALANLFQEFVVRKLTPHIPNYGAGKP
jgi:Carboxypeptidase regulatory-like domain